MAVLENLDEDEAYLYAILSDESGLDIAEFIWVDEENDDSIYRAWPFQWPWYRCKDKYQIEQGARSIGKSMSIAVRALAFPFVHPGNEMVITAPEAVHLDAITDKIETYLKSARLSKEMLEGSGRNAFKHKPFHAQFKNGARIMGRIPQRDGKGIKGCLMPQAPVLTASSMKVAGDVEVGDVIWTHQGWRTVTAVEHDVAESTYEVKGQGSFPLTVSWEHRFLGARDVCSNPGKKKRDFSDGLEWCAAEHLLEDHFYWATPAEFAADPLPVPETAVNQNDDFWWLVGRFLADGCTNSGRTGFHLYVHEDDQEPVVARLDRAGLTYRIGKRKHSSADLIDVSGCKDLSRWLDEHFGKYAHGKQLPGWVFGMPESHRRALLDGYLSGDGARNEAKHRWQVGTASEFLAVGLQLLAQSLGHRCSGHHVIDVKDYVTEIAGTELVSEARPSFRFQIYDMGFGKSAELDGYLLGKVKSVTPAGAQPVVNIITDAHSYMSGSIMSHNTHPLWLEMDEASDYPEKGWDEIIETLKTGSEGAVWRAHGVTRGVRDRFYDYTQSGSGWTVHHITAMARPTWSDEERQSKILQYGGSKDDPDYRRNVLGLHGDSSSALFVLHRLMACVDQDQTSDYNQDLYYQLRISAESLDDTGLPIEELFDPPRSHLGSEFLAHWIGMDVGYTNDPSEILVFGETRRPGKHNKKPDASRFELLARISLHRIEAPKQARLIARIIEFYRKNLRAFAMDKTGNGLPLFQILQDADWGKHTLDFVRGYNFSSKILVGFDNTVVLDEVKGDSVKDAGIMFNVKEYAQDCLRDLVDNQRILFPWDKPLIGQFQGGTASPVSGTDRYGRRKIFSGGEDHALDAARMMAICRAVYSIEELMKQDRREEVHDQFMFDDDDIW